MVALALALLCGIADTARAQTVTEFGAGISGGAAPLGITAGPDGNLWFTEFSRGMIGRITPAGVVTEFSAGLNPSHFLRTITAGPDGNLWFADETGDSIGRITPSGVVTLFSAGISLGAGPAGIAAGPDGNLWFTEFNGNRIGRITPAGLVTEFSAGMTANSRPLAIAAGPDGNLWFTELGGSRIGRITTGGVINEFSTGITANSSPTGITRGPDGNLWFAEQVGNRIGRITPAGTITEFSSGITANAGPFFIAAGADGNLWFTEYSGGRIGRITPAGAITEFNIGGGTSSAGPAGITGGPDGNLWFAEGNRDRIGQITTHPKELGFTPITPCRLVDTRNAVGPLGPRAGRNYAASDTARIFAAGGNAVGCGVPAGPSALVLTITAVAPDAAGNLVSYPSGTSVPLASSLNFLGGQVIANTTVVPIAPGSGDNFAVFNNSDGSTPMVVDVVGYFWENLAADCQRVSQAQAIAVGGSATVEASCDASFMLVGGGCSADTAGAIIWLDRRGTATGFGYSCGALNSSGSSVSVTTDAWCCRKPGR